MLIKNLLMYLLYLFSFHIALALDHNAKIYVAGHNGLVGSAILKLLKEQGYKNLICKSHQELDLCDQQAVNNFFASEKPDYVFLSAAKVGGIHANNIYPAEFIYKNICIEANVIHAAYFYNVKKLLFFGSSCVYPKLCNQPIKEEYLLSSKLEVTNKAYAIAKIAGIELCQSYNKQYGTKFISCMPTNLYGNNDNFDENNSHVIPGLINKFCKAQYENNPEVVCWGTGKALREFLHVDDLARASLLLMDEYEEYGENSWINIGTGKDITIAEIIYLIKELVGYEGKVVFDTNKPDGTPRKVLDISNIKALGWEPKITLRNGLTEVIKHYKNNILNKNK